MAHLLKVALVLVAAHDQGASGVQALHTQVASLQGELAAEQEKCSQLDAALSDSTEANSQLTAQVSQTQVRPRC